MCGVLNRAAVTGLPRAAWTPLGAEQKPVTVLGVGRTQAEIPQRKQLERELATTAAGLSDDEFAELIERGRTMTPEQALIAADKEACGGTAP